MNWKKTLAAGSINGAVMAIAMILLIILGDIIFDFLPLTILGLLSIILIPPFLTREIFKRQFDSCPSLKHLISVTFLTLIIPLFGATFGLPNTELDSLATLVALGTAGGAFWSIPFASWSVIRSRKLTEEE